MTDPLFVPEVAPVLDAMARCRQKGVHLALVADEYGGWEGLLTLNDVPEAVSGGVAADGDGSDRAFRRADGSWLLDGGLPAHEVRALLTIDARPGEDEGEYETLGGFAMACLGRIPAPGDATDWAGHRLDVVDMDGNRVGKVLASPGAGVGETAAPRTEA